MYQADSYLSNFGQASLKKQEKIYYLPFILPEEKFNADFCPQEGFSNIEILEKSPYRQENLCDVFTQCGGCSFQHFSPSFYQDYKKNHLSSIFQKDFPDVILDEAIFCPHASRRRTTLSLYRTQDVFKWGYKRASSKQIITPQNCAILTDIFWQDIKKIIPHFKMITPFDTQLKIHFTQAENGIDCVVRGAKVPNRAKFTPILEKILQEKTKLIRLIWDEELLWQESVPYISFANYQVELAPEMFLQASWEGQEYLTKKILAELPKKKKSKILDLFCGAGTFSLPLSDYGFVDAYDCAGPAVSKLEEAIKKYGKMDRLKTYRRDLYLNPLSKLELKNYDVIVCDPPRQGMLAQAQIIAQTNIPKIIMVFCDAQKALRDVKILTNSGYKIKKLSLIDQFVFTPHSEGVIVLEKN